MRIRRFRRTDSPKTPVCLVGGEIYKLQKYKDTGRSSISRLQEYNRQGFKSCLFYPIIPIQPPVSISGLGIHFNVKSSMDGIQCVYETDITRKYTPLLSIRPSRLIYAETTFGLEVIGIRGGTAPLPGLLR